MLYVEIQERSLALFGVSLQLVRATSVAAGLIINLVVMLVVGRALGARQSGLRAWERGLILTVM